MLAPHIDGTWWCGALFGVCPHSVVSKHIFFFGTHLARGRRGLRRGVGAQLLSYREGGVTSDGLGVSGIARREPRLQRTVLGETTAGRPLSDRLV